MASKLHWKIMDLTTQKVKLGKKMLGKTFKNYKRKGSI